MNKEKISSQEIIDLVASKASVSKRAAEEFLKVMIATIEEALLTDDIVKIKGFGTFKLQWNEPRKSVNVNTGEEIILAGYHKVAFTPEVSLKELVNEPFAHLESVQLDGENFVVPEKKDDAIDPLRIFTEQASEIKDLLSEIQSLSPTLQQELGEKEKIIIPDYFDLEKTEPKVELITTIEVTGMENEILELEPLIQENDEPQIESVLESETEIQEQTIQPAAKSVENEMVYVAPIVEDTTELDSSTFMFGAKPPKKSTKSKKWLWIAASLILLLGITAGLYVFIPSVNNLGNKLFSKCKTEATYIKENITIPDMVNSVSKWFSPKPKAATPLTETIVIPKDTSTVDSDEEVDSLQLLFDQPRVYTEFIASEQIKRGSRLTNMAKKYYGTKDFWVYIYEANKEWIQNADNIESGTLIRIPKLDPRLIDASNPRCIQKARELHDKYVNRKS